MMLSGNIPTIASFSFGGQFYEHKGKQSTMMLSRHIPTIASFSLGGQFYEQKGKQPTMMLSAISQLSPPSASAVTSTNRSLLPRHLRGGA
jgi:hypothetical protein